MNFVMVPKRCPYLGHLPKKGIASLVDAMMIRQYNFPHLMNDATSYRSFSLSQILKDREDYTRKVFKTYTGEFLSSLEGMDYGKVENWFRKESERKVMNLLRGLSKCTDNDKTSGFRISARSNKRVVVVDLFFELFYTDDKHEVLYSGDCEGNVYPEDQCVEWLCVHNDGKEDQFDKNLTYLGEPKKNGNVVLYDKMGQKVTMPGFRFRYSGE